MKTSQNGIDLIKQFEGCRLEAYKALPTEKYFTIGYGHMGADVKQGMIISQAKAEELLKKDLEKFEKSVTTLTAKYSGINQNQLDALASFTYNCGAGNLAKLVEGRTLAQVADAILKYNKAGGKELEGLTRRRKAERELFIKRDVKIIIGSARIDEKGNSTGGAGGDQKQKTTPDYSGEVSLQNFYVHKKGWYVLRPKDPEVAKEISNSMRRACNNNKIGYNQSARLEILKHGTASVVATNCDCSSLIRQCIIEASGKDPGNFTTSNEALYLVASGLFEDKVEFTSNMNLFEGDVLVTKTKGHTVAVVEGNQRISLAKNDNIGTDANNQKKKGNEMIIVLPTIKHGSTGMAVKIWQAIIGTEVTGEFNDKTLELTKAFQKSAWLNVDGIVGVKTWTQAFKNII